MKSPLVIIAIIFAFFATAAFAQTPEVPVPASPPSAVTNPAVSSVVQVLTLGTNNQPVVMEGSIIETLGENRYTFADPTGSVRVKIKADDYPSRLTRTDKVFISGEIDKDSGNGGVEVDVDKVKIIE